MRRGSSRHDAEWIPPSFTCFPLSCGRLFRGLHSAHGLVKTVLPFRRTPAATSVTSRTRVRRGPHFPGGCHTPSSAALADLPVELLGRMRSDRVLRRPTPPRVYDPKGRPPKPAPSLSSAIPRPGALSRP
jgi:hypothetical protein